MNREIRPKSRVPVRNQFARDSEQECTERSRFLFISGFFNQPTWTMNFLSIKTGRETNLCIIKSLKIFKNKVSSKVSCMFQQHYPIKFSNKRAQFQIRRIYTRNDTWYVRKSGQQNRKPIDVLYKFRLTADERSVANVTIDSEEIASVVADRNDAANAKETRFRRVSACDARRKSRGM